MGNSTINHHFWSLRPHEIPRPIFDRKTSADSPWGAGGATGATGAAPGGGGEVGGISGSRAGGQQDWGRLLRFRSKTFVEGKGLASERVFRHRFGTRSHASLLNAPPHHHHHHHHHYHHRHRHRHHHHHHRFRHHHHHHRGSFYINYNKIQTLKVSWLSLHQVQRDIKPKGVVALLTLSATRFKP